MADAAAEKRRGGATDAPSAKRRKGAAPEASEEPGMLTAGVSQQEYAEMKAAFEARHFYYVPANTFVEVDGEGCLRHYELQHAKEYLDIGWGFGGANRFMTRVSFLDLWRRDPTRKIVHRIDFRPSEDPTVYHLPLRFAYARVTDAQLAAPPAGAAVSSVWTPESHAASIRAMFTTLVKAATDDKPDLEAYFLNYCAHMLKHPLDQPGVSLIFTGQKGVGKDTLLDFLRLHVIGPALSHNYTQTSQFFDKHDTDRKDKIMVKVEDSDSALCKTHAKELRARITARESTVNPKGKAAVTFPNYVRYFFTANQAVPVGIQDDNDPERRFVIFPVANTLKGNMDFFRACYDEVMGLYTPVAGRIIADDLLARDIAGFNVRVQPKNEYQEALYESERSSEQRFVEEGWPAGAEFKSNELFSRYQRFCSDNGFPKWSETAIAFGQKLAYFVLHKRVVKRVGAKKQVYYKKPVGSVEAGEEEASGGGGGTRDMAEAMAVEGEAEAGGGGGWAVTSGSSVFSAMTLGLS